jgi:hypothetical protein
MLVKAYSWGLNPSFWAYTREGVLIGGPTLIFSPTPSGLQTFKPIHSSEIGHVKWKKPFVCCVGSLNGFNLHFTWPISLWIVWSTLFLSVLIFIFFQKNNNFYLYY